MASYYQDDSDEDMLDVSGQSDDYELLSEIEEDDDEDGDEDGDEDEDEDEDEDDNEDDNDDDDDDEDDDDKENQGTVSSTSDSDTDSEAGKTDWSNVPTDFLLTDKLIEAIENQRQLVPPTREESALHPAPTKLFFEGDFSFVEFIPPWTHPEWDDNYITVKGKHGPEKKIINNDVNRNRRPALLPRDESKNPTPYARRWGIHGGRTDGRSRLSPSKSSTRRVGLPHPQKTDDGRLKYFVTGEDLANEIGVQATNYGISLTEYLTMVDFVQDGNEPRYAAFLELQAMIQDDEDYQRMMFYDMTTDEVSITE
jgi:hypothetical protein